MATRTIGDLLPYSRIARAFLILIFFYAAISAMSEGDRIYRDLTLNSEDLEAFSWAKENTPKDSHFILVTGQLPLRDAWSEWFPVLTERYSQATLFGYEWVNDGKFAERVEAYKSMQSCVYQDSTCLHNWLQGTSKQPSFIYIHDQEDPLQLPLSLHLLQQDDFVQVFQNQRNLIFKVIDGWE